MAKKELVDYIHSAVTNGISSKEIRSNLKQAGWEEVDIKEALAYVEMYAPRSPINKGYIPPTSKLIKTKYRSRWINILGLVFGYIWLISGLNKIISGEFVKNFAPSIDPAASTSFYKFILTDIVLPNANLFANLVQYTEAFLGAVLIVFGLINFFDYSKFSHGVLMVTYLGSAIMALNIIFTFNIVFPWIDTARIFSEGVSVEYAILFGSIVLASAHFSEIYNA